MSTWERTRFPALALYHAAFAVIKRNGDRIGFSLDCPFCDAMSQVLLIGATVPRNTLGVALVAETHKKITRITRMYFRLCAIR